MPTIVAYVGFGMLATILETALDVESDQARRWRNAGFGTLAFVVTWIVATAVPLAGLPQGLLVDASRSTGAACVGATLLQIALYDLLYALWHRAQHSIPLLWRIHRLHHSDGRYDATTYLRHHPLEDTLQIWLLATPLSALLALPPTAAFVAAMVGAVLGFWNHLGARIPLGPFTRILSGPQLHRHHHASDAALADGNYAAVLPFWDVVMGTYVHPRPGAWPDVGLWTDRTEEGGGGRRDDVATGREGTDSRIGAERERTA